MKAKDGSVHVKVHYIKAPSITDIAVHGAVGGINIASGQVAMSVFSERAPIPRLVSVAPGEDSGAPEEVLETRDGVVRVVGATLYFDITVAVSLYSWLGDQIEKFEAANPDMFTESNSDV